MKQNQTLGQRLIKSLASIKLAVVIIASLAVISGVGTVVEARYDALMAKKLVYQSVYMYIIMALLCINLIFVMIDRWPWKKHHTGFVLAHVGILIILAGSLLTQIFGIDGNIIFGIGDSNRYVELPDMELTVYSTFEGDRYTKMYSEPVDFLVNPPSQKPLVISLGSDELSVVDYNHYALREEKIVEAKEEDAEPAIRLQLQNDRVNLTEWIVKSAKKKYEVMNLGPARVILSDGSYVSTGGNELILEPLKDPTSLKYTIHSRRKGGSQNQGVIRAGETVDTGWMNLKLRILKYLPHAKKEVKFIPLERPSPLSVSALKLRFNGKDHWLGSNSVLKLFTENSAYIVRYGQKRLNIGFNMRLVKFNVGRYQGTMRASSYESLVDVEGLGEQRVFMNNPLKHNGFTFYQASFSEDERGQPVASILSVNYDPGRPWKYLGSLLIVIGCIVLFYFKRMEFKKRGSQGIRKVSA